MAIEKNDFKEVAKEVVSEAFKQLAGENAMPAPSCVLPCPPCLSNIPPLNKLSPLDDDHDKLLREIMLNEKIDSLAEAYLKLWERDDVIDEIEKIRAEKIEKWHSESQTEMA